MTIQRLYSLPNCTLVLEGLSDATTGTFIEEMRPLLSTLVSVDCYLAASVQPLSGGRDFFESLIAAVSSYAQEFLSQVRHPAAQTLEPGLVQLQQVDEHRHRLIVQATPGIQGLDVGKNSSKMPIQIDLTTVQLFDLVEAVDQFLADSQTLPDFSPPPLLPIGIPDAGSSQILTKQAVPAAVGVYSLALSAIALFFVPTPAKRLPQPQPSFRVTTSNTKRSSQSYASPRPATPTPIPDLTTAHPTVLEITDIHQLRALNRKLYDQLNRAWTTPPRMAQNLVYRVEMDANGTLMGYTPVNAAARTHIDQTPLPNWHYNLQSSRNTPKDIAQFRVVFTKNGVLQVSPWWGYRGKWGSRRRAGIS
ncbi:MAG: DUF4335 domain-containing protein [Chroococcidiopsidaceae cyanobacterium CP_BM_RX_35]|nr:DUF4335 domain-containing protein [Chroococcidiopsidaceae cyanobacterium CP_BM_RX_35]